MSRAPRSPALKRHASTTSIATFYLYPEKKKHSRLIYIHRPADQCSFNGRLWPQQNAHCDREIVYLQFVSFNKVCRRIYLQRQYVLDLHHVCLHHASLYVCKKNDESRSRI